MLKTTYWALPCRTCGGQIALALVEYDSQRKIIDHAVEQHDVLKATCQLCGNTSGYATHDINLWEGPTPAPTFQPNPAFVRGNSQRPMRESA
jgi:hypothetical protein